MGGWGLGEVGNVLGEGGRLKNRGPTGVVIRKEGGYSGVRRRRWIMKTVLAGPVIPMFKPGHFVRGAFVASDWDDSEWVLLVAAGAHTGLRTTRGVPVKAMELVRVDLPGYLGEDWQDFMAYRLVSLAIGDILKFKLVVPDTPLQVSSPHVVGSRDEGGCQNIELWAAGAARTFHEMTMMTIAGKSVDFMADRLRRILEEGRKCDLVREDSPWA